MVGQCFGVLHVDAGVVGRHRPPQCGDHLPEPTSLRERLVEIGRPEDRRAGARRVGKNRLRSTRAMTAK